MCIFEYLLNLSDGSKTRVKNVFAAKASKSSSAWEVQIADCEVITLFKREETP